MRLQNSIPFQAFLAICCCLASLHPCRISAQEKQSSQISQPDTLAILKMIELAESSSDKDPAASLRKLEKALYASQDIQFTRGEIRALSRIGYWYFGNELNTSISYGRQALKKMETAANIPLQEKAAVYLLLAETYDEAGKIDSSAVFYYLLDQEISRGNLNNPEFAVQVFTKLAIFWFNINFGFYPGEEYKRTAHRFVEKAREASVQMKDTASGRSNILFIEGAYYHSILNFDSARYFYQAYLQERGKSGQMTTGRKISTLSNIANCYLQEKRPQEALNYIRQIREIATDSNQQKYLAFYMSFIDLSEATAFYQLKEYEQAISIFSKALYDIRKTGSHLRLEVVEAYDTYAKCEESLGNYQKALNLKNQFILLNDSLTKKDKISMVARLETINRIAEKDKELALQKLSLSEVNSQVKEQRFLIAVISLLTISGALIFGLWRKKNIGKQKLKDGEIANLEQKIRIERLTSSISAEEKERTRIGRELHDGVGGLLSVARMNFELARKKLGSENMQDFDDGIRMLEEATIELRKAAYNLMPEILLTQGLSNAVQAYCERMAAKSGTSISFQAFGVKDPAISKFDLPIYRIIQELVHNMMKHAQARHGLVQLNYEASGSIFITVEDDGIGLPADYAVSNRGMGLTNLKERVADLGGKLDIQSSPESGTSIYMEFDSLKESN